MTLKSQTRTTIVMFPPFFSGPICPTSGVPGAGLDLWVAVLEQLDDLEVKGLLAPEDLRC